MSKTITLRTAPRLRALLEKRAAATGQSLSEVIRGILESALAERPIGERTQHLRARLWLSQRTEEPWRKRLRERNWRP